MKHNEQHSVKEYWIIDPESETVEVLALADGRYELLQRSRPGETAASRLLPGFEVSVNYLFRGASSREAQRAADHEATRNAETLKC